MDVCPEGAVLARVDAHEGLAEALGVPSETWFCGVAVGGRRGLEEAEGRIRAGLGGGALLTGAFRLLRLADWRGCSRC